jgi:hypothetical protein
MKSEITMRIMTRAYLKQKGALIEKGLKGELEMEKI